MNENMRRLLERLGSSSETIRHRTIQESTQVRDSVRRVAHEILDRLENQERSEAGDPAAIDNELDRKSKDIADDLRRVERLIRERKGQG